MLSGPQRAKPMPESGTQPHILVVDDARDIREPLVRYLKESGYRASAADGAASARRAMRTSGIDLVILDIMMPGEDGLSLCRSIRESSGIPVIMLTARGEELDRIVGLEVGADDYVAKPFNPRELLARVGAVLRRTNTLPPRLRGPTTERYRFGEWTFNAAQREIVGPEGLALPLANDVTRSIRRGGSRGGDPVQSCRGGDSRNRPRRRAARRAPVGRYRSYWVDLRLHQHHSRRTAGFGRACPRHESLPLRDLGRAADRRRE